VSEISVLYPDDYFGGGPLTGMEAAWCEATNMLAVRFLTTPMLYGPRGVLRRAAFRVLLESGRTVTPGQPFVGENDDKTVYVPIAETWPRNDRVVVFVSAHSAETGLPYGADPLVAPTLIEEGPVREAWAAPARPREDFASDRETGAFEYEGDGYGTEWGISQLLGEVQRYIESESPFGLDMEREAVLSDAYVARLRTAVSRFVSEQPGVVDSKVEATVDRAAGLVRVDITIETAAGMQDGSLSVSPA